VGKVKLRALFGMSETADLVKLNVVLCDELSDETTVSDNQCTSMPVLFVVCLEMHGDMILTPDSVDRLLSSVVC